MSFSENVTLAEYVSTPDFSPLPDVFATIFPFYIVLNRDLEIIHIGPVLKRLYPEILKYKDFKEHFEIKRPNVVTNFDSIRAHPRSLFLLESIKNRMQLKGQIVYVDYEEVILFLGSPWITDTNAMADFNLKVSDFALHDPVADFLFLLQAQSTSLKDAKRLADKLAKQKIEIRKALIQEQELNELKTRFITTASHEFRTPLGIISSSTGLLEDYDHKLDRPKKLKHWQRIQSAVKHMTTLLEDILLIYQTDAGKLECKRSSFDPIAFCHELIEEIEISSNAKGRFDLTINYADANSDTGQEFTVFMDSKLVRQILTNLLSNAIKYTLSDSQVRFNITFTSQTVTFQITDRGIGISDEDRVRLFESFHRGSNVSNIPGTGLGLSIVKRCVDLHGGTIDLTSEVDVGTTFIVNLPLG
ncbi:ATP-binding protein [Chamaesiphon minutus]|uniref:Signal transduction histidine kinase n=1 Tax=Chamaesiphon minutus (strain ATCC 27169 / PCC 6605) TaxID=1173020 RepID=K9UBY4_CHAP6|nr:ATP-binding protein [Chamaesiphon minutus]AFY92148.1 signal transduction histidine kinase [Chamaesiphon minutus PCC 6605]